jgi:hypothetical protein
MKASKPLWLLAAASIVWGSYALVDASDGGLGVVEYLLYFYGGLFFGTAAVVVAVLVVTRNVRRGVGLDSLLPLPLALQLLFLAVVFVGVSFDFAFRARFRLSLSALESAAEEIRSGRREPRSGWIGLFHVTEVDRAGSAVRFITADNFLDHTGLVHCPVGEPPVLGEDSYQHFRGRWWRWHRSW